MKYGKNFAETASGEMATNPVVLTVVRTAKYTRFQSYFANMHSNGIFTVYCVFFPVFSASTRGRTLLRVISSAGRTREGSEGTPQ